MLSLKKLKENDFGPLGEVAKVVEPVTSFVVVPINNDAIWPFKNAAEIKLKATELKEFFANYNTPNTYTLFGKGTPMQNPRGFVNNTLELMVKYWHNQSFVVDRIFDLEFIKKSLCEKANCKKK